MKPDLTKPAQVRKQRSLFDEFAAYYRTERCRWAPKNPYRIFGLAFKSIFRDYRSRLSPEEFLSVIYATLGFRRASPRGLFQTFDPNKYHGQCSLEDHFVNLFGQKLRGKLDLATRRMTDTGRECDPKKFREYPELGLMRDRSENSSSEKERALLHDLARIVLSKRETLLSEREQEVIRLVYWEDMSFREAGTLLSVDHKTVARRHKYALQTLRRECGVETILGNLSF